MLKGAIWFLAFAVFGKKTTSRHSLLIKLLQETTVVAFHAQSTKPVTAYGLKGKRKKSLNV